MITLRGITWKHPRGSAPLLASASAYSQAHPDIRITWEARTLQEFADFPIDRLAERFDLLVIDHPFVGFAAATRCLLPFERYVGETALARLAEQSVGPSHVSYAYAGSQWALAMDAAAQVSAYRPDLLERTGRAVPSTWEEVLALGQVLQEQNLGRIALPAIPIDALMSFCTLCANLGEDPFEPGADRVVSRAAARYALDLLRGLIRISHPESLEWNPPRTLDRMSHTDEVVYCPLLFGYSNYARDGFAPYLVRFTDIPTTDDRGPVGAILGGTGIAVAARCRYPDVAIRYARWLCEAEVQRGLYFAAGGQPGNRLAWLDPEVNAACHNYFVDTLATLDAAYLRPRYNGFIAFQDEAGQLLHHFLRDNGSREELIDQLDHLYRQSQSGHSSDAIS